MKFEDKNQTLSYYHKTSCLIQRSAIVYLERDLSMPSVSKETLANNVDPDQTQ